MKPFDEKLIIQQLQHTGTRYAAFTLVVNEYREQLYWQIRRMVLNHDDADDILQNTFIKAWSALDTFRGDAKVSSWLYRIANNETINFLERKREMASIDTEGSGVAASLMGDPYFDGDETQAQLQEAIAQLPDKQRAVFNMKYFQEMKYEDISEVTGTSIGALKASYHHAVKKISEFFNNLD